MASEEESKTPETEEATADATAPPEEESTATFEPVVRAVFPITRRP